MKLFAILTTVKESKSLPPRERELKPDMLGQMQILKESLPPRERELKLSEMLAVVRATPSLPPRERELKLRRFIGRRCRGGRSPRGSVN